LQQIQRLFFKGSSHRRTDLATVITEYADHAQVRRAHHLAGHGVFATYFRFRYGSLALVANDRFETGSTGPFGIDLMKAAYPTVQPACPLQVLTMLWAGTAAEHHLTNRRCSVKHDADLPTVSAFVACAQVQGRESLEALIQRARYDARACMQLPRFAATVEMLAGQLLDQEVIGHFTARRMVRDVLWPSFKRLPIPCIS
jgi:hypothetical protein